MREKQADYIAKKLLTAMHPQSNFYGALDRRGTVEYVKQVKAAVALLEKEGIIHFPVDDRFY